MKLHQRLIEVRAARQRVRHACRQSARYTARLHRQFDAHPLAFAGAAAGGGLLVGLMPERHGRALTRIWHDPTLRWVLHLLIASAAGR